jgi:hypothetical protein
MTEAEEKQLRVEIIGIDGIRRSGYVPRSKDGQMVELASGKYRIRDDAIFISVIKKYWGLKKVAQPTIVFRENETEPVKAKVRASDPHPNDIADAVSRSAWAIAQLIVNKEENWKMILLIMAIVAAGAGGVSAYISYDNSKNILALQDAVEGIVIPMAPSSGSTLTPTPTPTFPGITNPTTTPTPTQTIPFITGG